MDGEGLSMLRTELMQEIRKMRFKEAYEACREADGQFIIVCKSFLRVTVLADFHKKNVY